MSHRGFLVVDDEEDLQELLRVHLSAAGFRVTTAGTGEKALALAMSGVHDGIILDLMLPDIDGFEVIKRLKAAPKTRSLPVLVLSAKVEDADIVAALELGAEDFVTKPFSPRVLLARLKAMLQRRNVFWGEDNAAIRIHDLQIHPHKHELLAGGRPVLLTNSEFLILQLLAQRPGWVFTRAQILAALHDGDTPLHERSVDYLVASLRRKLGSFASSVETVRGVGYRVRPP